MKTIAIILLIIVFLLFFFFGVVIGDTNKKITDCTNTKVGVCTIVAFLIFLFLIFTNFAYTRALHKYPKKEYDIGYEVTYYSDHSDTTFFVEHK